MPPPPPRVIARTHAGEQEGVNWGRVMGVSVGAVGLMAVWKAAGGGGGKKEVWCQGELSTFVFSLLPSSETDSYIYIYFLHSFL